MVYELACGLVATTVVDSVALKSSALNSFQYSEVFLTLNLKDLRREFRLAHLVPNQNLGLIEIY